MFIPPPRNLYPRPSLATAASSVLSVLRQTDRLNADYEIPILLITLGLLMLLARWKRIPRPDWYIEPAPTRPERKP